MRKIPWAIGVTGSVALLLLALNLPVRADTDRDVSLRIGGGEHRADYGAEWWWGDPVLRGDMSYYDGGLFFGVHGDDWQARFRTGDGHTDYNDRPGYRVFIPRGREYPPEYYNGGPGYQPGGTRVYHYGYYPTTAYYPYGYSPYGYNPYGGVAYYPPAYYGPGSTVVIDNRYLDTRRSDRHSRRNRRVYTAPSYPELGYGGPAVYYDSPPLSDAPEPEPQIVNDNRTYNYYYGDSAMPAEAPAVAAPPAAPPLVGPPAPATAPAPATDGQADYRPYGVRFYDRARIGAPAGEVTAELVETALYVGPASGELTQLTANADPAFGAYLAYQPGAGVSVIFREGDSVLAAYPGTDGTWWQTALGLSVDFSRSLTLGLVGGAPWLVFETRDGTRYVYAFRDTAWQEVGSGS